MEKYLRLLNPKTTNFDAIGGGNFGALTKEDVLLSMSYARLSTAQDTLLKCLMGHFTIEQIEQVSMTLCSVYVSDIKKDHLVSFRVAMIELFACPANYKPSERNRAVLAGVSDTTVHRRIGKMIDMLKEQIKGDLDQAINKINKQLKNHLQIDLIT